MSELIVVTKAIHIDGHKLELTFSDGVRSVVDFSSWIERFPFFKPLKDINYFKSFQLDGWTVSWPNGADIAPETLHTIAMQNLSKQPA